MDQVGNSFEPYESEVIELLREPLSDKLLLCYPNGDSFLVGLETANRVLGNSGAREPDRILDAVWNMNHIIWTSADDLPLRQNGLTPIFQASTEESDVQAAC